jgi:flagellar biosynthesis protein FlhF
MRLKRIEATTVAEAMRRLRKDLGEDAVILSTRTLSPAVGPSRVEILGAVDAEPVGAEGRLESVFSGRGRRAEIAEKLARFQAVVPTVPLAAAAPATPPPPVAPAAAPAAAVAAPEVPGMPACRPPEWTAIGGRARRIAFVGPTGAGKTTTLAKVAARALLDHGRRVGIATIDTYRIGAVPQLASYADILGVPLAVAQTPEALASALDGAGQTTDVMFIDTIGRSPLGGGIAGLAPFLDAARADEVCLVMPVTMRVADAARAAAAFARLGPSRLCITKLDETDYHEPIAAVSQASGLPLTWLGTGQNVPDDLEAADPARLAGLLAAGRAA